MVGLEALIQQLGEALRNNSRADSVRILSELIRIKPPFGNRWKSMAAIAKKNGEVDDAILAMKYYCEAAGSGPSVQYELAALCAQLGRVVEADKLMAALPSETPNKRDYYYSRGTLSLNLGRVEEARENLRRACKAAPNSGQSWLALAMAGPVVDDDRDALIAAQPGFKNAEPIEKSAYHYAFGKALDEIGEHDEAFRSFSNGAAAMRDIRPYDHIADRRDAHNVANGWAAHIGITVQSMQDGEQTIPQIFVTGLPRSGTTLVEQILSSHSDVEGGEELGLMQIVTQDCGKTAVDFGDFKSSRGTAGDLVELYQRLLAQRRSGKGRFVDKSLNTSRYLGLIAAIFDEAPIIWLRRDPLDCAWSAYRTWFLQGLEWSWALEDIGRHFAVEDALFDHWRELLGDRMLVVEYADLVTNPAVQIDRINRYCGMTTEEGQSRPHETVRAVKTASVAQVRQPINTKGLGNSEPYHQYMQSFQAAYDSARSKLDRFA